MFDKPTRNHFTVVFERLGGVLFFTAAIILANINGEWGTSVFSADFWRDLGEAARGIEDYYYAAGMFAFLTIMGIILFVSFRFWRKTVFYIEDGYLIYERNTLYRKKSRLPLEIISTVNLERNVFERIAGTAKVKLDINSAQTSDNTDFTLVLSLKTAQSFKQAVTAEKMLREPQAEKKASAQQVIVAFTPAQVLRHKLLSLPVMQGLFAAMLLASQFYEVVRQGGAQLKAMLVFALVCGVGAVGVSVLNTLDYTVSADEKNFYITKGRLKKVSYTFSRSRINAVFVKQPLLARVFGYSSVEVAVIGLGNESKETPCLCLLADKQQTQRILRLCAADFAQCGSEPVAQSRAALIPAALCIAIVSALSLTALFILRLKFAWVAAAAVIVACAALLFIAYRAKSVCFDAAVFHSTKGVFMRQTGMFRCDRMQTVTIKTNPVMRRAGAEKMNWSILSGHAMTAHGSGWLAKGIFEQVAEKTVSAKDASTQLL